MINYYIRNRLDSSDIKTYKDFENVLREEMQKIILLGLSRTNFFLKASFYGGTCLRIFHHLNRFSEDLDFEVINNNEDISFIKYIEPIITLLKSYGIDAFYTSRPEYEIGDIRRVYIKTKTHDLFKEYMGESASINEDKILSIKCELNMIGVDGANYSQELLTTPIFAKINCFDMPSLFAGKVHAVLCREWKERVKGRDYYDYLFYIQNNTMLNTIYLFNKLSNTYSTKPCDYSLDLIKTDLYKKFENIDIEKVLYDLSPFTDEGDPLTKSIDKDILLSTIQYIF